MRHIKLFESFVSPETLNKFREIFWELEDIGYSVFTRHVECSILPDVVGDGISKKISNGVLISNLGKRYDLKSCDGISVDIYKSISNEAGEIKTFNKVDVVETIEFAKSYCVELGYRLNFICYTGDVRQHQIYTTNIDLLGYRPLGYSGEVRSGDKLYRVILSFIKI